MNSWLENMTRAGLAGPKYEVSFQDDKGNNADDASRPPVAFKGNSVSETINKASKESNGANVFGMSYFKGYHSIIITRIDENTFELHDEYYFNPVKKQNRYTGKELDKFILSEAKRLQGFQSDGKTPWKDRNSLQVEIRALLPQSNEKK